jgi:hypothetical protein
MNCPKCGFEQSEGSECLHCGIIFTRYHEKDSAPPLEQSPDTDIPNPKTGYLRKIFRIVCLLSLGILLLAIILIFHKSQPPEIKIFPDSAQLAEDKIKEFQEEASQTPESELRLDESELNGWLGKNLALKPSPGNIEADATATKPAQSSIRDLKIKMREDSLVIYAVVDAHGMNVSLELEGEPQVIDGYLRLNPKSGKLGSLPLTDGMLQKTVRQIFDSPENSEKFRLPPQIQNIRIENGQLIVTSN